MRHMAGIVLAVAVAAAVFFGAGWAVTRIGLEASQFRKLTDSRGITALAALGGTGLLLGLVTVPPGVSPLAPGLPGLAMLGWTGWWVVSPARALRFIPLHHGQAAAGFSTLLTTGFLGLLGLVMIIPLFVPSRWRRRYRYDDGDLPDATTQVGLVG
jgi:hypothetical protein